MAKAKLHRPALRFAAIFSRDSAALDWACQQATRHWGEILRTSPDLDFDMTSYYERSMGTRLRKRLVAFADLIDPVQLVDSKQSSNQWETEYRNRCAGPPERPLNIDPGYLTEAKVVLATMKDRDHRLYLGDGVYGEVTLFYQLPGRWISSRWTYPDYQREAYHEFFTACREYLRDCLQKLPIPD